MRTVAIAGIVHQLRHRSAGARSDAELLDAFIAHRDEDVFGYVDRRLPFEREIWVAHRPAEFVFVHSTPIDPSLFPVPREPEFSALWLGRRGHQVADRGHNGTDCFVMTDDLLFQFAQFLRELLMRRYHPT